MPKRLRDVKIHEVSLVKSPANRRKFLFYKDSLFLSEEEVRVMEELREELASFIESIDVDLDEEVDFEKISEGAKNALIGAIKILKKYLDDFPDDIKKAIKVLVKYVEAYPYPYPTEDVKKEEQAEQAEEKEEEIEKVGRKLAKGVEAKFREIIAEGRKLFDSLSKLIDDLVGFEEGAVEKEDHTKEILTELMGKIEKLEKQIIVPRKSVEPIQPEVRKDENDPFPSLSRFFEEG